MTVFETVSYCRLLGAGCFGLCAISDILAIHISASPIFFQIRLLKSNTRWQWMSNNFFGTEWSSERNIHSLPSETQFYEFID